MPERNAAVVSTPVATGNNPELRREVLSQRRQGPRVLVAGVDVTDAPEDFWAALPPELVAAFVRAAPIPCSKLADGTPIGENR